MNIRPLWIAGAMMFAGGLSHAAVPPVMSYQGKLTDAAGRLVPDGSYGMRFSLYAADSGGSALWAETWEQPSAVPVTNGQFGVMLGSRTPLSLPFDEGYWLGVEVKHSGSWEALSPRQRIASAAYAFMAGEANVADIAESVTAGAITSDSLASGAVTEDKIRVPGLNASGNVDFPAPTVTGIDPAAKTEGYSPFIAAITGANFQSISQAKIGEIALASESVASSTSMTAIVPEGVSPGIHDVSISNLEMEWGSLSDAFVVYTAIPTATPTSTPTVTPTPTPTPDVYSNLISYYALDDTSGDVIDATGNDHGINSGPTRGVTGKIGTAFSFDGNNDTITSVADVRGYSAGTISYWFRTDDNTLTQDIYSTHSSGHDNKVGLYGSQVYSSHQGEWYLTAGAISNGTWYFYTCAWDSSGVYLYLDGILAASAGYGGGWESTGASAIIGARAVLIDNDFKGVLDEVGLWNRALSGPQVNYLYNSRNGRRPL